MQIEMTGRTVLVVGGEGAVAAALTRMLIESGADVARAADAGAAAHHRAFDSLVVFAPRVPAAELAGLCTGLADMFAAGSGRILLIGSALGLVPMRGQHQASAAAAATFALTRTLAMELAERGIRVNALALGAIGTGNTGLVSHTAIRRAGTPDEAAAAALFLIDPKNSYMTGQVLAADGGWSAGYVRDF